MAARRGSKIHTCSTHEARVWLELEATGGSSGVHRKSGSRV